LNGDHTNSPIALGSIDKEFWMFETIKFFQNHITIPVQKTKPYYYRYYLVVICAVLWELGKLHKEKRGKHAVCSFTVHFLRQMKEIYTYNNMVAALLLAQFIKNNIHNCFGEVSNL
jgi:hypothetical protein